MAITPSEMGSDDLVNTHSYSDQPKMFDSQKLMACMSLSLVQLGLHCLVFCLTETAEYLDVRENYFCWVKVIRKHTFRAEMKVSHASKVLSLKNVKWKKGK